MTTTADLLDEYAQSLRRSWGGIDGRSEKIALNCLSAAIRQYGATGLSPEIVARLRGNLGVCPEGQSHWGESCEWYHGEVSEA